MRIYILLVVAIISFSLLSMAPGRQSTFKWKMATDPYRNYLYPSRTGLKYTLNYAYPVESKSLRRFLHKNYDVRASVNISRVLRDISLGIFFDRYFDVRIKYLQQGDTLVLKTFYENRDSTTEYYAHAGGALKLHIHLTRYKHQHDYSLGMVKDKRQKGLVTGVDISVKRPRYNKSYVMIMSRLFTEADMPGILSEIKGKKLFKK